MITVLPFGAFYNRTPLAYAPILERLAGELSLVDDPQAAQIVAISHHKDLELFGGQLCRMVSADPKLRIVLLSEEPFWDSCWAPDPFSRFQIWPTADGPLPYVVINHHTSHIWQTQGLPYFLLTDPQYFENLRHRFVRNAGRSAADWQRHFNGASVAAAFIAEKRTLARHAPQFPAEDMWGLSVYRSDFARSCQGDGVMRLGTGWSDGPARKTLENWHEDKLQQIDQRCRYVGAFENTHQLHYVSEKIFDAFATGAVPLYFAAPGHAVHRYIGDRGWMNFFATPPKALGFDANSPVSQDLIEGYVATQNHLAALFTDPKTLPEALDGFAERLLNELRNLAR